MYSQISLSELKLSQSNTDNNDPITLTKIKLQCYHCNVQIRRYGTIYITPIKNIALFFCSSKCRRNYKEKNSIRTCFECGIEIPKLGNIRYCSDTCASAKFNKTFVCQNCSKIVVDKSSRIISIRKFCSQKCANGFNLTKYSEHYFCDMCRSYVKKSDAIIWKAKIRTFMACPKPSCNHNRLRTNARRTNAKDKENQKFYYENE